MNGLEGDSGLAERLAGVRRRMAEACARCGREPGEVELVAVSKTHGPERVREAVDCGLRVFGESRVQEARAKIPLCPGGLSWHLVGHLQTNKVRVAVDLFDVIHSVDSTRLLEALEKACTQKGRTLEVLVEVNVSGEASKYGIAPGELEPLLDFSRECTHVDVIGLMTVPPWSEEPERTRVFFSRLRELRDEVSRSGGYSLPQLSMGMSNDFETAIEEGATMVRIGTAIFGRRTT